jgi:hypothetical protein
MDYIKDMRHEFKNQTYFQTAQSRMVSCRSDSTFGFLLF